MNSWMKESETLKGVRQMDELRVLHALSSVADDQWTTESSGHQNTRDGPCLLCGNSGVTVYSEPSQSELAWSFFLPFCLSLGVPFLSPTLQNEGRIRLI